MFEPEEVHPHYAYGTAAPTLETVMRFHAVKRWHMIDTTRQQTLAEHSANVALLAFLIAKTAPVMFFGPAHIPMMLGLMHDLEEVFTGDIPTPTKLKIGSEVMERVTGDVLPPLFEVRFATDVQRRLVKLCDLADSIRFIRLHGVDITATHARRGLEQQLRERLEEFKEESNPAVFKHVLDNIMIYAYEQH